MYIYEHIQVTNGTSAVHVVKHLVEMNTLMHIFKYTEQRSLVSVMCVANHSGVKINLESTCERILVKSHMSVVFVIKHLVKKEASILT